GNGEGYRDIGGGEGDQSRRIAVNVENDGDEISEEEQDEGGEERVGAGEEDGIMQALAHAAEFAGAEILADDRADRAGQGENDAERNRHQAVDDGDRRHRRIAELGSDARQVGGSERSRDLRQHGGNG